MVTLVAAPVPDVILLLEQINTSPATSWVASDLEIDFS